MKNYSAIATILETELEKIQNDDTSVITKAEVSLKLIRSSIAHLQNRVVKYGFNSVNDEVKFFKGIQPKVHAYLIFYSSVIDIELKRMVYSPENHKGYITEKIASFQNVFQDNLEFMRYYNSKSTHFDKHYFTRETTALSLNTSISTNSINIGFTTGYDHLVTNILAYKLLQNHLEAEQRKERELIASKLQWTGDKISMAELIYALHSSEVISNGKSDLGELCAIFENIFNFEMGNIYRAFTTIKRRKSDKTRFMNQLNDGLNMRIELLDEK